MSVFLITQGNSSKPCNFLFHLKDADNKGRFNSPMLDVTERQIILEKNQMLQLNCR